MNIPDWELKALNSNQMGTKIAGGVVENGVQMERLIDETCEFDQRCRASDPVVD